MKRTLTTLVMAFGLGSLFLSTPISAQDNHPAVADIPFSFAVSGRALPAGKYNISQLSPGSSTFTLRNEDGRALMTQLGSRNEGHPDKPSVTFKRYGSEWVLVQIAPPESLTAYSLLEDKTHPQKIRMAAMVSIKLK